MTISGIYRYTALIAAALIGALPLLIAPNAAASSHLFRSVYTTEECSAQSATCNSTATADRIGILEATAELSASPGKSSGFARASAQGVRSVVLNGPKASATFRVTYGGSAQGERSPTVQEFAAVTFFVSTYDTTCECYGGGSEQLVNSTTNPAALTWSSSGATLTFTMAAPQGKALHKISVVPTVAVQAAFHDTTTALHRTARASADITVKSIEIIA